MTGVACVELGPLMGAAGLGQAAASDSFLALLRPPDAAAASAHGTRIPDGWLLGAPPPPPASATGPTAVARAPPPFAPSPAGLAGAARYLPAWLLASLASPQPPGAPSPPPPALLAPPPPRAFLAETRAVSVVFLALPVLRATDLRLAQAMLSEVHCVSRREGGAPVQTVTDDKGTTSIAVWGRPPLSHADDPQRALAAASQLVASLQALADAAGRCAVALGSSLCPRAPVCRVC